MLVIAEAEQRYGALVTTDNHVRRFVYPTSALAAWLGIAVSQ